MMLVKRPRYMEQIEASYRVHPATAILGPRQCGKTTLGRMYAQGKESHFFDLEDPVDMRRLEHPQRALEGLRGLVVLDEVQRRPGIYELLRVLLDREETPARFLLLGSAAPELVKGVSESLAGRIGFVDLCGFDCRETGAEGLNRLWFRGGFPRAYLAGGEADAGLWLDGFMRTFLERDIPQLGISAGSEALRRFWTMIAHYHGQVWNGAEFARSLGASVGVGVRYLDILCGSYMVRRLAPWHENLKKRQVKAPKVYVRDSGVLHRLLGLASADDLQAHPKLGASWEGFALENLLAAGSARSAYFWATHAGAELDLLLFHRGRRLGFEFKYADAPDMTKSLHIALQDLGLERAWIVYPGKERYRVHEKVEVIPLPECMALFDS